MRLYGRGASIQTTVRPFQYGSFEIEFLYRIASPENMDILICALVSPSELLKILKETVQLFKHLGGSPPKKVEPTVENRCNVENNHGVVIQCQKVVLDAALDRDIGMAAESFVRRPLRNSAERVEITAAENLIAQIQRDESEDFRPLAEDDELTENKARILLKIETAVFEGRRKWRFSDGSSSFSAEVEDEEFLSRVRSDEERFGKGDTLLVDLRTTQNRQMEDYAASMWWKGFWDIQAVDQLR